MRSEIFYAPDDGGTAGGTAGGAAGGSAAAAAGGVDGLVGAAQAAAAVQGASATDSSDAAAAQAQGYAPDGLDTKLRGKSDRETIDNLFGAMKGIPKAPEKAADYTFEPAKGFEGVIDAKNDKVLPIYREIAHKLGMTQEQFSGSINQLASEMQKAGLLRTPADTGAEFAQLGGEGDQATRLQNGQRRVGEIASQIDGLATRRELSADQAKALKGAMTNASTVVAMERLLGLIDGGKTGAPRNGGQTGSSGATRKDVEARMTDPRYDARGGKFDRDFYDETNRLFEQTAGTG